MPYVSKVFDHFWMDVQMGIAEKESDFKWGNTKKGNVDGLYIKPLDKCE